MPYGYSKRIYKKKYKMALERIVLKITKAYNDKHDRKYGSAKWPIVICVALKKREINIDFDTRCPKMSKFWG